MFLMTQTFCFVSYTIRKRKRKNLTCSSSLLLKEKKKSVNLLAVCLPDNPELRPLLLEFNRITYWTSMLPSFGSLYSNYFFLKQDNESTSCPLYNL